MRKGVEFDSMIASSLVTKFHVLEVVFEVGELVLDGCRAR